MNTITVEIEQSDTILRDIVHRAVSGVQILFSEGHKPVARLLPICSRMPGLHEGKIKTGEDFDEALPDQFWCDGQ